MDKINFIKIFQSRQTEELFTECACYYFALILKLRFGGCIMYNPDKVHFATNISGILYDITGVIDKEGFVSWDTYDGDDVYQIYENCIRLV